MSGEIFPWDHVESARNDAELQAKNDSKWARLNYGENVKCPNCNRSGDQLSWYYFSSPSSTWRNLCGRAGWIVVCEPCHQQVQFFSTFMN